MPKESITIYFFGNRTLEPGLGGFRLNLIGLGNREFILKLKDLATMD